jgi:hypothetical protein
MIATVFDLGAVKHNDEHQHSECILPFSFKILQHFILD